MQLTGAVEKGRSHHGDTHFAEGTCQLAAEGAIVCQRRDSSVNISSIDLLTLPAKVRPAEKQKRVLCIEFRPSIVESMSCGMLTHILL
jgi:hypothetical protein